MDIVNCYVSSPEGTQKKKNRVIFQFVFRNTLPEGVASLGDDQIDHICYNVCLYKSIYLYIYRIIYV